MMYWCLLDRGLKLQSGSRLLALALTLAWTAAAAEFHVSPSGLPNGAGSADAPWSLAHALSGPPAIQPGDVVWVHGGMYAGPVTSRLMGARDLPIIVRGVPGERAVIDGRAAAWDVATLKIEGSRVWFWGIEVTNSLERRLGIARSHGIELYAPYSRLINMIVHDAGQGLGVWVQAVGAELYGNLVFDNGWTGADRGHGHGVYTHNEGSPKIFRHNIIFNPYSFVFHAYGSEAARLNNFLLEGNVFFNAPFLVGGSSPAQDFTLQGNYFYNSNVSFGYDNRLNGNLTIADNYFAGYLYVKWWNNVRVTNNVIFPFGQTGQDVSVSLTARDDGSPTDFFLDNNTYVRGPARDGWDFWLVPPGERGRALTFPLWQRTGFDQNSSYEPGAGRRPSANRIFIQRNEYEAERAFAVVYNWEHLDTIELDVSALEWKPGDVFEVRNVQNYFAEPLTGTYEGRPLVISMQPDVPEKPALAPVNNRSTFPEFGVFILTVRPGPGSTAAATQKRRVPAALRRETPGRIGVPRMPSRSR
jgi:hypothetical protein